MEDLRKIPYLSETDPRPEKAMKDIDLTSYSKGLIDGDETTGDETRPDETETETSEDQSDLLDCTLDGLDQLSLGNLVICRERIRRLLLRLI